MAEEVTQHESEKQAEATPEQGTTGTKRGWRRIFTRWWLVLVLLVSLVAHGAGFAYFRLAKRQTAQPPSPEVSLGTFRFEAPEGEIGRISSAEFSLHIALLDQIDVAARRRLDTHRFRVQQDVEELLRKAHSGDFDDPDLGELKRQLQERINETLDMRVIADVIITDLKLHRLDLQLGLATDQADSVPWVEQPSG